MNPTQDLVERLCSRECAGRGAGTLGGIRARALVVDALRAAGLDPFEQKIGSTTAANVLAKTKGDVDRWVLVAAHYDHLGGDARSGKFYPGADDNAAAVAILADVAQAIAKAKPEGRGVLFAAFDAEEPPWFLTGQMGSAYFAEHAREAVGFELDRIDMMVCMDLVGHALGPDFLPLPDDVKRSVFALGAERSAGTAAIVDELARAQEGVVVRRADAEIIPPLSDYDAFWKREVPFVFLTSGRSARYHTPEDTPEHVDYAKVAATGRS
jgi:Zn-dependent M28 family amino/carboxypeptidase